MYSDFQIKLIHVFFERFKRNLELKGAKVELIYSNDNKGLMMHIWYKDKCVCAEFLSSGTSFGWDELTKENCGFNTGYENVTHNLETLHAGILKILGLERKDLHSD